MFFNPRKRRLTAGDVAKKNVDRSLWTAMLKETVADVYPIISKWDSRNALTIYDDVCREEARRFLIAVSDLRRAMKFLIDGVSSSADENGVLSLAKRLLGTAMKRLRREFYVVLSHPSADEERVMADLREIAECMEENGCGEECVEVYKSVRRLVIGVSLYRRGFDNKKVMFRSASDWDSVEKQMISWMVVFGVAIKTIFSGERFRSDCIFNFSDTLKELCFSETIGEIAENFLSFPCVIAGAAKSMKNMEPPAILCRFLDLHSTLSDHLGDIEEIFSYSSTYTIRNKATASVNIVGELIRSLLSQFESSITKNTLPSAKSVVASGGIHPLTRYVMNHVVSIVDHITTLSVIYADYPPSPLPENLFQSKRTVKSPDIREYEEEDRCCKVTGHPNVSSRLAWVLLILLCNLNKKSDLYKNPSLSYLFLSNNLQFVVQKVRGSKLRYLLGEEWVLENERKAMCYMNKYLRGTWRKVMVMVAALAKCLTTVEFEAGKKMIGDFNSAFAEACRAQSGWIVEDKKTREKVKNTIRRNVIEPYRSFCNVWCSTVNVQMSYSPEELGIFIDMVISDQTD